MPTDPAGSRTLKSTPGCFALLDNMIIFFVAVYLVLLALAVWYFVSARGLLAWTRKLKRFAAAMPGVLRVSFFPRVAPAARRPISRLYFSWQQHRRYLIAAASIVMLPAALAVVLRSHVDIEGFSDVDTREIPVVSALLQGEQLVPPPPLPPASFLTDEVQAERPRIQFASRDWALLDADFRQRLLLSFRIMEREHGYPMVMLEGYRSPERQNELARMGSSVTHARAYQSYHQFGLAADAAFVRNGKIVISEQDPWAMRGYTLYGRVAESVGLKWGGRWKLLDLGHVELPVKGVLGKPAGQVRSFEILRTTRTPQA